MTARDNEALRAPFTQPPAAPPTLRRDDTSGASEARRSAPAQGVQEAQVDHETAGPAESSRPAITLQVMQEALRLMPSDEARRVAREAEAVSGTVTPEQYVGAGAIAILAKLRAPAADQRGLLPCPFCGSEAFETFKTDDDGIRRHSVHCKAPNCGGQTRDRHFSEAKAIAACNRRAALASAPVAAPSNETLRLAGVIADKIEDGTLFQAGIFSRRELADKVRAVVRFVSEASAPVADERDKAAISQFLTDVMTAAGLVSHGKRCKALAERLGKACMDIRLSGVLASAPVAWEAVGVVQPNGDTFRLSRPLPVGTKVYAAPPVSAAGSQEGEAC